MIRILVAMAAVLSSTGCVLDARQADTVIGAPRLIEVPVSDETRVKLRVPAGDVEIRGVAGETLRGELILKCADLNSRCARRLEKVEWLSEVEDDRVGLRLSHDRSYRYREGNLKAIIEVPRNRQLTVKMTAGDLRVAGVEACLSVDMGAGDVEIRAPAETVRRVALDAGVGDADLTVGGRHYQAQRSWLIGAEIDWEQGSGGCDLVVDLQAGDISVRLY